MGEESSDLAIHHRNNGIIANQLCYNGIIYHKVNSKQNFELNNQIQVKIIADRIVVCCNGINKYLKLIISNESVSVKIKNFITTEKIFEYEIKKLCR